jgi:sucrose-6-phosphate hydrolase SacC (GH32 family)
VTPGAAEGEFTYFWFGEERGQALPRNQRAVSCYSSKDLVHWTFRKDVFTASGAEIPVLERPKVFYNRQTKKFVMYVHYDDANYRLAEVGVATSDKVDGPYTLLKHFRPLNHESRDIGQFIDDDGTAYLIFEDRPNGWHIAKLSEDYLNVEKDVCLIKMPMEGGAMVHYNGLYYAIGSRLTGWSPNPNQYATAKSLEGPWSAFKDIVPRQTNTYGSQSTMLLKRLEPSVTS